MALRKRWTVLASTMAFTAVLAVPSSVRAYRAYRDATERSTQRAFVNEPDGDEHRWRQLAAGYVGPEDSEEAEGDDPRRRMVMRKALWGDPSRGYFQRAAQVAAQEAERWSELLPAAPRSPFAPEPTARGAVSGGGQSWVNLGPTDASFQWNGTFYSEVDSGRAAGIQVDPRDPQVVYFATSGGGVWKTFNFSAANPSWFPITETLGNIAIGAMDMDPNAPDTLYLGLGDAFDLPGGYVVRTTNGGASWSAPVLLTTAYPAGAGGLAVPANTLRDLKVDPANSNRIVVGTDVGLFKSEDGGASFTHLDLPNSGTALAEAIWSVAFAGSTGGNSRLVVSGVYACGAGEEPLPPGYGVAAGGTNFLTGGTCVGGTLGDVWVSSNSGTSWTSLRATAALPSTNVGRITLAAGGPKANPATTVLYAQLSALEEAAGSSGNGIWRSTTGGASWAVATGTLANATSKPPGPSPRDCGTVNVNEAQAWYNSTIAVDPANDANVLVGGMLCGLRTTTGTASTPSWENVAHWLPSGGGGDTSAGALPYVHADWHRSRIVRVGATIRAFAGTDGGIYFSDNLFAGVTPPNVVWRFPNRGIVTHLAYSLASGDPANGNPFVAFMGLQDNGTRFRDSATTATTFNQVIGGDGFGAAVGRIGGTSVYWGSVNGRQSYCVPSAGNAQCNNGGVWTTRAAPVLACGSDASPFLVRIAASPVATTPTFLTLTDRGIFKSTGSGGAWAATNTCLTSATNPATNPHFVRFVNTSETVDGLYGAALSGGRFAITSNCPSTTTGCTWTVTERLQIDLNGNGTLENSEWQLNTSGVAFPPGPTGRANGQDFVVVTAAPENQDGSPVPLAMGRIFQTTNRGSTWTPINGFGGASPLPDVPINAVKYDPADLTNQTIYVGTDLGVYRTIDGGTTWQRYGTGLPLVKVTELFVGRTGQIIRIGTFGRGGWEIYPSATSERGVSGNGDFNRDQQIDIVDLAASATRLGTNTLTTTQPYYDWNMDLLAAPSNGNAIEDADLSAVLGKFGGRP